MVDCFDRTPSRPTDPLADQYDELRLAARGLLERLARDEPSLGPTELVHEAAVRLLRMIKVRLVDRRYVFAAALQAMGTS
ncbi:MAG: ECF-type sigma factor [Isosphaeraceae bacterium]